MAGRKQHYIPQTLQKGFTFAGNGKKSQLYHFTKNLQTFSTSTEGSGATRDFYSNPIVDGFGSVDDLITDFEATFLGGELQKWRSMHNEKVDSESAAVVVTHLAIRTDHIRNVFSQLTNTIFDQFDTLVKDPIRLRQFLGIDSPEQNETLTASIRSALTPYGADEYPAKDRQFIESLVCFKLRETFSEFPGGVDDSLFPIQKLIVPEIPRIVGKSQSNVLKDSMAPKARVNELSKLDWHVIDVCSNVGHFILPDCVVVANTILSSEFKPYTFADSEVESIGIIIMPITSSQLLVGCRGSVNIDQTVLNQQFAKCSINFFISSRNDEDVLILANSIGMSAVPESISLFEENPIEKAPPKRSDNPNIIKFDIRTPSGKFGNQAKSILQTTTRKILNQEVIQRVDAITVPSNVSATLTKLKGRSPTEFELAAIQCGSIECVKVRQEWKCHIIFPRPLVEVALQRESSDAQIAAISLMELTIGRTHYYDCWARQHPSVFENNDKSLWDQISSNCVSFVASFYFAGMLVHRKVRERHDLDADSSYELANQLESGLSRMAIARENYFLHGHIDQFVLEAISFIEMMLSSIAAVMGILEQINSTLKQDSQAGKVLTAAGLWSWSQLFFRDLRSHYERRYLWTSKDELKQLKSHIDRLFWTVGIVRFESDKDHLFSVLDDQYLMKIRHMLEQKSFW